MAIPLARVPGPRDLIRWTYRTATTAVSVPGRLLALLDAVEAVVGRADELVRRSGRLVVAAEETAAQARRATEAIEVQVAAARPLLEFVEEFSQHEVRAAIELVNELPRLSRHLTEDVLPILNTLDHVGPDIHELLSVVNDVRQAILGVPGFDFLRRRGEDKDEKRDD
jgi:methyl-accepting chemotaxis protein